jgi:hypothetical protein
MTSHASEVGGVRYKLCAASRAVFISLLSLKKESEAYEITYLSVCLCVPPNNFSTNW